MGLTTVGSRAGLQELTFKQSGANESMACIPGEDQEICVYRSLLPQWLNFKLFWVGFPTKND